MKTSSFDDTEFLALEGTFSKISRGLWVGLLYAAVIVLTAQLTIARGSASLPLPTEETFLQIHEHTGLERCSAGYECDPYGRTLQVRYSPNLDRTELIR